MSHLLILSIGFLAQAFFSARILVQWILSERARRVLSPSIFWVLSLAGSCLLCLYGWLRDDFSIILGQFISYYIYLWNLNIKGIWHKVPAPARYVLMLLPVAAVIGVARDMDAVVASLFRNEDIPVWLIVYGSAGQVIFTLRFVYQWLYSRRRHESVLPVGFWVISLTGSAVIVSYGIFRLDPVLVLGQSVGFVAYVRNIIIARRAAKNIMNDEDMR